MKSLFLPTLFALAPLTLAQQALIPSTLPACAAQCQTLQNAQTSCQTNPTTQQSCFCQSALLTSLYSTNPAGLAECTCTSADLQTIGTWYQGFCKNGAAPAAGNQPTTTSPAAKNPSVTGHTTTPSAASATAPSQSGSSNGTQGPW